MVNTTMKLQTGGKGLSQRQNLFRLSAGAEAYAPTGWGTGFYDYGFYDAGAIPAPAIEIAGKPLGADGKVYFAWPDNVTRDVTPTVNNRDFYTFFELSEKHKLLHQTLCTAPGNANNARTIIGIGEQVAIYFDPPLSMTFPEEPFWYVLGEGSINPDNGSSTLLTAHLTPGSATVKVVVRDVTLSASFGIVPPSSIEVLSQVDWPPKEQNVNGILMGAETDYLVAICPTNVSFNKVLIRENPEPHSINVTWPNGTNMVINFKRTTNGFYMDCGQYIVGDKIISAGVPDNMISSNYLYNGVSNADFNFGNTWTYQYQNDAGTWVDFAPLSAKFVYRGSDKQCHVEYLGHIGGWEGPY